MEWRFTSAVQNGRIGSKIRKMNRPSVIRARGHMVSLYPYRHKSKEVEPIKWFGFFLWHGYCAPCFTTGKFIEEAVAVVDDRLAALLEKS